MKSRNQITKGAFSSKSDPAWQEMLELAKASVTPQKYHDVADTCGRGEDCVCGCCWVRENLAVQQQNER